MGIYISKYDVSEVGTVYTANWKKGPKDCWDETESKYVTRRELIKIALHSLGSSPSLFLKELKLHYFSRVHNGLMIRLFGVTRETVTGHFMMVAETIEWDLRHYVSHHFARLTWSRKLSILHSIACALEQLHNGEQVHRDKATNGQLFKNHLEIPVNELGLGKNKNSIPIIGYYKNDLLPFMAPEILRNEKYTKKSDIYSFGIIMWELCTNSQPFHDKLHKSRLINSIAYNELRPSIENIDVPDCYIELMKKCWSSDLSIRPNIRELVNQLGEWHMYKKQSDEFEQAERIRIRRMKSKGLDTSPNKLLIPLQIHPQAIYTSRKLKFPIIPLHTQKILRNITTYEDPSSTIDLASLTVKDQSFFTKNNFMQQRKLEEEEIDEDLARQYELSIPFERPLVISS
ncbi:10882_t:CDS:2 [Funneliformis geosporum]|uniref:2234_t:CDS:1 n=1 Tax=Funneliformis geosporum TaxID=1117311 RepID=A0A9W4SZP1_9GLOM|nr:10882_t:CDS:2 [Funneliformis geosporum]CAI2189410.1 2234_t:CDS:2 [Funneliformis geosporum]